MPENTEPEDAGPRRALDERLAATAAGEGEPEAEGLALLDRERWAGRPRSWRRPSAVPNAVPNEGATGTPSCARVSTSPAR